MTYFLCIFENMYNLTIKRNGTKLKNKLSEIFVMAWWKIVKYQKDEKRKHAESLTNNLKIKAFKNHIL